jgi:hypothetical protein
MAENGGTAGEIPGEASAPGQESGDADLPEADVALALGVSAGTVKTHLALATLRASIGADFEEGYVHELQA